MREGQLRRISSSPPSKTQGYAKCPPGSLPGASLPNSPVLIVSLYPPNFQKESVRSSVRSGAAPQRASSVDKGERSRGGAPRRGATVCKLTRVSKLNAHASPQLFTKSWPARAFITVRKRPGLRTLSRLRRTACGEACGFRCPSPLHGLVVSRGFHSDIQNASTRISFAK